MSSAPSSPATPRASRLLMIATYIVSVAGLVLAFITLSQDPPSLTWATLLTVVGGGALSFVRHAVTHRSDAVRLGWDYGTTNAFQIEAGVANGAWALVGLLAVVLGWGLVAEGTVFLVFGVYMIGAAIVQLILKRGVLMSIASATFGIVLCVVGWLGVAAA